MKHSDFKVGDYIYYYKGVGDTDETIPTIVIKVHKKMLTICSSFEPDESYRVLKTKCEHQD